MPQQNAPRRVKSNQQMILALELRASGASYMQIGKALSVSKTHASVAAPQANNYDTPHSRAPPDAESDQSDQPN